MSRYHEVAARVAVDPQFAEYVRTYPTDAQVAYGLSDDELRSLLLRSDHQHPARDNNGGIIPRQEH